MAVDLEANRRRIAQLAASIRPGSIMYYDLYVLAIELPGIIEVVGDAWDPNDTVLSAAAEKILRDELARRDSQRGRGIPPLDHDALVQDFPRLAAAIADQVTPAQQREADFRRWLEVTVTRTDAAIALGAQSVSLERDLSTATPGPSRSVVRIVELDGQVTELQLAITPS